MHNIHLWLFGSIQYSCIPFTFQISVSWQLSKKEQLLVSFLLKCTSIVTQFPCKWNSIKFDCYCTFSQFVLFIGWQWRRLQRQRGIYMWKNGISVFKGMQRHLIAKQYHTSLVVKANVLKMYSRIKPFINDFVNAA